MDRRHYFFTMNSQQNFAERNKKPYFLIHSGMLSIPFRLPIKYKVFGNMHKSGVLFMAESMKTALFLHNYRVSFII